MNEHEPSQFLREEMQRETDEAREAAKLPVPTEAPSDDDELFQAHMLRFPGQHE
jgi:hypothetical protein